MKEKPTPPHPNNLTVLMKRDGVSQADIARIWNVDNGDASQRVNGKVRVTRERAKKLFQAYGWSYNDIYDDESPPVTNNKIPTKEMTQYDAALVYAIKLILQRLIHHKVLNADEMATAFSGAAAMFLLHKKHESANLLTHFHMFVEGDTALTEQQELHTLLSLVPLGSS